MAASSAPEHQACLNRPFAYAVAEEKTGLPVFPGAVTGIPEE